ncbi:hypothetical protein ABVT39_000521 [Epinephelus coioides]
MQHSAAVCRNYSFAAINDGYSIGFVRENTTVSLQHNSKHTMVTLMAISNKHKTDGRRGRRSMFESQISKREIMACDINQCCGKRDLGLSLLSSLSLVYYWSCGIEEKHWEDDAAAHCIVNTFQRLGNKHLRHNRICSSKRRKNDGIDDR